MIHAPFCCVHHYLGPTVFVFIDLTASCISCGENGLLYIFLLLVSKFNNFDSLTSFIH